VGVEIGVWEGGFAQKILEGVRPDRLFLVDPWRHDPRYPNRRYGKADWEAMERRYGDVLARFDGEPGVTVIRAESGEVWDRLPPLDWAYIDGNHSFEYVLADLKGAHGRLRPGGLIVGDDCHLPPDRRWAGVFDALLAFLRSAEGRDYRVEALRGGQFVIRKPKTADDAPHLLLARNPRKTTSEASLLFTVLSQPRTGTHLIRSYLGSHPDIRCEGEIFHPRLHWPHLADFDGATPADEVIEYLYEEATAEGKHLGFIVHDHGGPLGRRFGWSHELLAEMAPRPLLIWLYRRNVMAQFASWILASQSERWADYSDGGDSPRQYPPLEPPPEEFRTWLLRQCRARLDLRKRLATLPSLSIAYEDLCESPHRECGRVFRALGALPVPVATATNKQRAYRVPEIFANYEQLVGVLADPEIRSLVDELRNIGVEEPVVFSG